MAFDSDAYIADQLRRGYRQGSLHIQPMFVLKGDRWHEHDWGGRYCPLCSDEGCVDSNVYRQRSQDYLEEERYV